VASGDFNPQEYLNGQEFNPNAIDRDYPNFRHFHTGSLFISHAGLDQRRIDGDIVYPVVYDRFGDGYLL
jgi:hypothetical protein